MRSSAPMCAAIRDETVQLDWRSLNLEVDRLSDKLLANRVGLLLANGVHWACLDLALLKGDRVCVPMPEFFSDSQLLHLIRDADLDMVVTDHRERVAALLNGQSHARIDVAGRPVWLFWRKANAPDDTVQPLPRETVKVTYTSGTTGQPKGVCLSGETIGNVTACPVRGGASLSARPGLVAAAAVHLAGGTSQACMHRSGLGLRRSFRILPLAAWRDHPDCRPSNFSARSGSTRQPRRPWCLNCSSSWLKCMEAGHPGSRFPALHRCRGSPDPVRLD